MSGVQESVFIKVYTAEYLFDHQKEFKFPMSGLYESVSSRLGNQPNIEHIIKTVKNCGFSRIGGVNISNNNRTKSSKLINETLSGLYGYLATKEETDPGPMDYTLSRYDNKLRGCYSYDFMQIRPYVLRYLYYERLPEDIVNFHELWYLRSRMKISDRIEEVRYRHSCARILYETGYKKRSLRGAAFDPVHVTRGRIIRELELCHRELSGDLPPKQSQKIYLKGRGWIFPSL